MKKLLILLLILTAFNTVFAQSSFDSYTKAWRKVHRFELDQLPRSASAVVDSIYDQARKDQNHPQQLKALIYQAKFAMVLQEEAQLKAVRQFEEEISRSPVPLRNLLQNLLANIYWQHFNQHRWEYYQRTRTKEKVNETDFRTWDPETLFAEVHRQFDRSLQNASITRQQDLNSYNDILEVQEGSKMYRPTLFDFLAHNALLFYKSSEISISKPAFKFEIDHARYFSTYIIDEPAKDSLSLEYQALQLYEKLLRYHEKDQDPTAFVTLLLERLAFVRSKASIPDKNNHYLEALIRLSQQYHKHEVSAAIDFNLAGLYHELGNEYEPGHSEEHRFKQREALQICERVINRFPASAGAENCVLLRENILKPSLAVTAEKYIPTGLPSRLLVEYNNLDSLYLRIIKVSHEQETVFHKLQNDAARLDFINALTVEKKWGVPLRNEQDYQSHKTEVVVPALSQGNYLLVAGNSGAATISDDQIYGYSFFQLTNLALVQSPAGSSHRFQLINRNTGEPLTGAAIHMRNRQSDSYNKPFNRNFISDQNGQIEFSSKDYHYDIKASVKHGEEQATFGNYYFYQNSQKEARLEKEELNLVPFLFTDRSIYRPGQTIYFKGILIKKQGTRSEVVANEYVQVYLEDVNEQEVRSLRLKTNEFGSFSSEFLLPANGLPGEYTIYVEEDDEEESRLYDELMDDFEWIEHTISVEEYKRPKFEAAFEPVKETYQLNDTVRVKGSATAYAGSNISGARVSYRVHRKVQYPRWFYWSQPGNTYTSEAMEITHGETTTDGQGAFNISFAAIPDKSVDRGKQPVFQYELTADITDINGETRSATTQVKVGYHSMQAHIHLTDQLDKNIKDQELLISTQNLNGQKVEASGTVKIYKVKAPEQVLRKRPWPAPDYQELSRREFKALFPHDPYEHEGQQQYQEKGRLVLDKSFDTSQSDRLALSEMAGWESGLYVVELTSSDIFGQDVTDKKFFNLFSPKDKKPADNMLFTILTDKGSYKPGETVKLQMASAAPELVVTVSVEKGHEIVQTSLVKLSGNSRQLQIPVSKKDLGGFVIHYSYAAYNSFEQGKVQVQVTDPKEKLEIETITFRDKLQAGGEEQWTFRIKDSSGDRLVAEMLASMYDASLDQFKSHEWSFTPLKSQLYYSYTHARNNYSFGTHNLNIRNRHRYNYSYPRQQFDQLNWFGFSMNGQAYAQQRYLWRIAQTTYLSSTQSKLDTSRAEGYIYGVVRDLDYEPLPGVAVRVKGSEKGQVTDVEGNYHIKAAKGDELVFSFVGYEGATARVGEFNVINVTLVEDVHKLEEVVVVGYGEVKRSSLTGSVSVIEFADQEELELDVEILEGKVAGVQASGPAEDSGAIRLRGTSSAGGNSPLFIVDGVPVEAFDLSSTDILGTEILKGAAATALYGARGANGVVIISTKEGQQQIDARLSQVQARKNLQETAFFYPHLQTDKKGIISFSFTRPEALTRWKLQLLAHTKTLITTTKNLQTVTQKELMVTPNPPRFLREGDQLVFSSKISNLMADSLRGFAALQLFNAISGEPVNEKFGNALKNKSFSIKGNENIQLSWSLKIPEGVEALQYKIVATSGNVSDGEQQVLPVLPNRMLVTESLPFWSRNAQSSTFSLDKLRNNTSSSLKHHRLTLELTSNPVWYAVQALPYLMEYPYECVEQTFAKYYANALASHIVNSNPIIKEVFDQWTAAGGQLSKLEQNEELKSILIQETPWLREAQSESEQKKQMAALFDLQKMSNQLAAIVRNLQDMQLPEGGFPWFSGSSYPNRFISQHIVAGYGHLRHLGVDQGPQLAMMMDKTLRFLDNEIVRDYSKLKNQAEIVAAEHTPASGRAKEEFLGKKHLRPIQIHYLYLRSFYKEHPMTEEVQEALSYYSEQSVKYWKENNLYLKGMIALALYRNGNDKIPQAILTSLKETSICSDEMGMYWKENKAGWYWQEAPVETQALLIEAFTEIEQPGLSEEEQKRTIDELKVWLLRNKQTRQWASTKATTEAVYALLLQGSDWVSVSNMAEVSIGNQILNFSDKEMEAGTGYFKTAWQGEAIRPEMSEVKISKRDDSMVWGGLYWQYFEDLDKITEANTSLQIKKGLFLKKNTHTGEELVAIEDGTALKVGDLLRVRIELRTDRDMDFVHMKDLRASGMEPVNVMSAYKWQDGLGYYESTKDASTNFFFDHLPKGIYVFEYDLRVNNQGEFSNGITSIQSMYAPEFSSHSEGKRVSVRE